MASAQDTFDTLIIGAGLAGLTAARSMVDAGRSVMVIDKGRGFGGRMATRRIGEARLDHGAQFFTTRTDAFAEVVAAAVADGVVDVWCHGFAGHDGHPRYYCPSGMTGLAKWMAGQLSEDGARIELGTRAAAISKHDGGWVVPVEGGPALRASNLIVTTPVPQTLDLLSAGGVELEPDVDSQARAIEYAPVFALLVTLDGPSNVGAPGGVQQPDDELFTFVADNQRKGVSNIPALTFHVHPNLSAERWDDPRDDLKADLLEQIGPWLGGATVVESQLHGWKYAIPRVPHPERHLVATGAPTMLVFAGDAFGGAKVEGAFSSGFSAANAVLAAS